MADCQLYGLRSWGLHLTNVVLHAATVIALFLALRQMTGAFWRSAFVAAVFAIHPLRAESVAWVSERKDVLSGLFFILTIWAYTRYAGRPRSFARYGLLMLLFAMGLMAKSMLVTLPLVLLLLDYWPLRRTEPPAKLVLEKLPLLALSILAGVEAISAQKGAIEPTGSYPMLLRCANALITFMVYLRQMVWPVGLSAFYPYPHHGLPGWEVALAGILVVGISLVVLSQRRKEPWLLVGWVWYLVMLLPVAGIIQVSSQAQADRYTYLPQIGIYIAITWSVAEWHIRRPIIAILMSGIAALLIVCGWRQTSYWRDSETLWSHAISCTANNDIAQNNLGALLMQKGQVDEAIPHFQQALEINPEYAEARYNLGLSFYNEGRMDKAIGEYQQALKIQPEYAEAGCGMANAFLQQGKVDAAIAQYEKVLETSPGYAEAEDNLGNAFLQKGNVAEAIPHFQKALRLEPEDPGIQNNLAWALAVCPDAPLRNGLKAVAFAQQANLLTGGNNPILLHTLAAAFAEAGQYSEAMKTARHALQLATEQSNQPLAAQLQREMKFYQTGRPYHLPAQPK
jgi:tetratricopeptide (TPR) repeat protein